jgi:hypothetical protein
MPSKSRISHNRHDGQARQAQPTQGLGRATQRASEAVRHSYDAAAGLVSDNPATSVLIVFGVGFGLGLLIGHVLGQPAREESGINRFGRAMLDRMAQIMPESVSKLMPDAISRRSCA